MCLMNICLKNITIGTYCMNNAQNVIFKSVMINKSKLGTKPEKNKIIKLGVILAIF